MNRQDLVILHLKIRFSDIDINQPITNETFLHHVCNSSYIMCRLDNHSVGERFGSDASTGTHAAARYAAKTVAAAAAT